MNKEQQDILSKLRLIKIDTAYAEKELLNLDPIPLIDALTRISNTNGEILKIIKKIHGFS
jgi:hypothetical protein